jgi:Tfp pilus assembly PilM family ATPase
MHLFPISPPTLALSISEEALCLVEIKKQWRKTLLHQVRSVSLPQGVVKLSSAKPNIENPEEFLTQLKTLVEPCTRPLTIALSLPDLCARTSVFDFSTFPTKKHEQTALVNWRFQQDLKLDISQSRLGFEVYVPTSVTNSPSLENCEKVRVLGTAIRNEIVEQYEKMCLEANLIPTSVGISGLDIFDLYRPNIRDILEAEDTPTTSFRPASGAPSPGAMFLFISLWGFTFLAFQDGVPRFIRTKAISVKRHAPDLQWDSPASQFDLQEGIDGQEDKSSPDTFSTKTPEGDPSNHPYPSYTVMKVGKEILATLQYYLEAFPFKDMPASAINLFVVTDLNQGHSLVPPPDQIQHTLRASGKHEPQIRITALSHSSHFHLQKTSPAFINQEESALPGYASMMVA